MKKVILILALSIVVFAGCSENTSQTAYSEIQDLKYERILTDFHEKNHSFSTAYKVLNPLDTNQLSAYIMFTTEEPLKYEYTVTGKTSDADFTYVHDEFEEGDIVIPVVGLYADYVNTVEVMITTEGGESQTEVFEFDTTPLYIPEELQKADVTSKVDSFDDFLSDKWVINTNGLAYDENGDLRVYGLVTEGNSPMNFVKVVNGKYFVTSNDVDGKYYSDSLYQVDMMGRVIDEVVAPEGIMFHHDMTFDGENYYVLGTYEPAEDEQYLESLIVEYDSDFNYIKTIDLGDFFTGQEKVLANTPKNDIHFNSINYLEEENQLIISSRALSDIFAYDLDTDSFEWILGEKRQENENFENIYLESIDSENDEIFSGQHSAIIVEGERVAGYEEGQYLLALYDNRSCEDSEGNNVLKVLNEETEESTADINSELCSNLKSSVKTFKIDLNEMTFDMVDNIQLDSRNSYVSNINQFGEFFVVGSPLNGEVTVYDNEFNKLGKIEYPTPLSGGKFGTQYRASVISEEEINNLFV